ncbi:hypothetical protein FB564_4608 [Salinispora arenicola]|uniref:Amine oxidase domain-containing protein n=1 Tax=Salinispora arenicola TaxID=168697 RepID=A0A542XU33_SALAC|nr:hypothetical protein FB564_4608 [Salinispora arenicola]
MRGEAAGVVVVGAGLAGLACARELARVGIPVRVRERGRSVGGRMASRRSAGRAVDLGAAYLTVSDPGFAAVMREWRAAGLAREWTDTFLAFGHEGRREVVGPMRWAAPRGLRSLVEHLARTLPVRVDHPVRSVRPGPTVDGQPCAAVVLAMPGPQAAPLLDPALTAANRAVRAQGWSPSLAAALRFPDRCWSGLRGAFVNDHPVLALVCDDGDRRGDGAPVLVAHTTPDFAAEYLHRPDAAAPPSRTRSGSCLCCRNRSRRCVYTVGRTRSRRWRWRIPTTWTRTGSVWPAMRSAPRGPRPPGAPATTWPVPWSPA